MSNKNQILLEDFMDVSMDIICVIDEGGQFIKVSQICAKIWGYKPEELIGKAFIDFVAEIDRPKTAQIEVDVQNGKGITHFENHFIHKNGDLVPMIWSAKFDQKKGFLYCVGKENTLAKEIEIKREKVIQSSQAVINGTKNMIWSIDKNYKLLAFNSSIFSRFKTELNVTLKAGTDMLTLPKLSDSDIKHWKDLYDRCLNGETIEVEIPPTPNSKLKPTWILANLTPIYENQEIIGIVCHSTDVTEKKKIELELIKQNKLVKNILEHIPMGIAVNEISTGKKLLLNKDFSKTYGWPEDELTDVDHFFTKVYPDPAYRERMKSRIMEDMHSGDIDRMRWSEIKVKTKLNQTKYVDAKNIPLVEDNLMISTVLDVTESIKNKKQLEKALADKNNILESISDAFYALDHNFNFTYLNTSALKLLGKSNMQDLKGKNLFSEYPDLQKTAVEHHLLEVQKTGNPARFEFYYNAYETWFDENIYRSTDGFSVYFKDISDRKIIQAELEESYKKESTILESISDAFIAVDHYYNFTYLNKRAEKLLNLSKADAVGKNMWELFDYSKDSIAKSEYEKAIKNNETRTFDYYNEPLKAWFNIRAFPSKNGLSIYFSDVTHEKKQKEEVEKLNSELKSYTQKLEESNKNLEQFAYIASHDLQEPLRMVTSFLGLLQSKYENNLDDKAQAYINFAVDGAKRMRQIIIDLLEYSKASTQNDSLEKLDLNEEIAEVLGLYHASLSEYNISLEIQELPTLKYSKTGIRQLFNNFIGNAIKYRNKEGQAKINISWTEDQKEFIFEIKDNGIGIDQIFQERIFQIFKRLHSKSAYPGTGLGLAICKKIVEKYGGKIWVESQIGVGSSFFFTLPQKIDL